MEAEDGSLHGVEATEKPINKQFGSSTHDGRSTVINVCCFKHVSHFHRRLILACIARSMFNRISDQMSSFYLLINYRQFIT